MQQIEKQDEGSYDKEQQLLHKKTHKYTKHHKYSKADAMDPPEDTPTKAQSAKTIAKVNTATKSKKMPTQSVQKVAPKASKKPLVKKQPVAQKLKTKLSSASAIKAQKKASSVMTEKRPFLLDSEVQNYTIPGMIQPVNP